MRTGVLVAGAVATLGLAVVSTFQSTPASTSTLPSTSTPSSPTAVVATVPPRDPGEAEARQQLAAAPEREDLATKLAHLDITRYRRYADPRYLGRAQATLGRWWTQAAPPPEIRFERATILQATHQFPAARIDLDALAQFAPDNVPVQLERAVVATVTADYAAARASCEAIAPRVASVVVAACVGPLDEPDAAYARLLAARQTDARYIDPAVDAWVLTTLAELAVRRGDWTAAETHARAALALDAEDNYARDLVADILIATNRAADASALLAGREVVDSHLLRRAIAETLAKGPQATQLVGQMRGRIADAAERGDRVHAREECRFALVVDHDAARAVKIAVENWGVQKELADARLLAEAAVAAQQPAAAAPVKAWREANHMTDAQLDAALARIP